MLTSNNGSSGSGYVYQQPGQSGVGQPVGNTVYSNGPNQGYGYMSQPVQSQGTGGYPGQASMEQQRSMHDPGRVAANGAGDGGYRVPGQSAGAPQPQPNGFPQQSPVGTVSSDAYIVKPPVLARGKTKFGRSSLQILAYVNIALYFHLNLYHS